LATLVDGAKTYRMNTEERLETGQRELFDAGPRSTVKASQEEFGGPPRLRLAEREQVEFRAFAWNDLLPFDHQARIVWDYVEGLDLSPLLVENKAIAGQAGAPRIDPRIMMTLWLYATLRGIGSARELARRCESDLPFQWICGGVAVNHHTLSDFRVNCAQFLDDVLTKSVAVLLHQELVDMQRVAQDGMRVRASAGAASFSRKQTLEELLIEAEQQVQALKNELESDPAAGSRRQEAARKRAAEERLERIQAALQQIPELEAKKKAGEEDKARASTTDADARVMKMADGGFRPAFNVQLATDTKTQIITGVDVVNSGSDRGQMAPMVQQHEERYGKQPEEYLVDGGFATKDDIEEVSSSDEEPKGTTVYAPVQKSKDPQIDSHTPRKNDSPSVAAWRLRMATDEAKEIYKDRASTAECVNAIARNRGLQQFGVRGLEKVRAAVLWYVLAHNLMRTAALRAQRATNQQ
jgi:transposase